MCPLVFLSSFSLSFCVSLNLLFYRSSAAFSHRFHAVRFFTLLYSLSLLFSVSYSSSPSSVFFLFTVLSSSKPWLVYLFPFISHQENVRSIHSFYYFGRDINKFESYSMCRVNHNLFLGHPDTNNSSAESFTVFSDLSTFLCSVFDVLIDDEHNIISMINNTDPFLKRFVTYMYKRY